MLRLLVKLVRMVVVLILVAAAACAGLYVLGSSLPQSHVATLGRIPGFSRRRLEDHH
jgi:hypothetical protein